MFKSRIVLVRNWSPGSRSANLNGSKHIQKHDQFHFFLYSSLCIFTFQIIWEYKHHHENDNIYDSQKLSFQIHETTSLIYCLVFFLVFFCNTKTVESFVNKIFVDKLQLLFFWNFSTGALAGRALVGPLSNRFPLNCYGV